MRSVSSICPRFGLEIVVLKPKNPNKLFGTPFFDAHKEGDNVVLNLRGDAPFDGKGKIDAVLGAAQFYNHCCNDERPEVREISQGAWLR